MRRMVVEDGNAPSVSQLRRGVLGYCVLALLQGGPRYGFDIVRSLSEAGMVTSEGTIYPLLARLRREGAVASEWQESPSGPPRRYYRLTAAGVASLRTFADEWASFSRGVDRLLEEGARP